MEHQTGKTTVIRSKAVRENGAAVSKNEGQHSTIVSRGSRALQFGPPLRRECLQPAHASNNIAIKYYDTSFILLLI